jgi:hypothetical protein
MIESDKGNFKDMMNSVCTIYSKSALDKDTLRIWYYKFEKFEFGVITHAFDKWVDTSRFMPTPSDILAICKEKPIQYTQLLAPKLSVAENKAQADKLLVVINARIPVKQKELKDYRSWAHRIIASPKKYPAISLQFAKQAIHAN